MTTFHLGKNKRKHKIELFIVWLYSTLYIPIYLHGRSRRTCITSSTSPTSMAVVAGDCFLFLLRFNRDKNMLPWKAC